MIRKGVNKIGIILNTDPHYKEGSHWVSVFINISKRYIFSLDSTGDPPQRQITKFIKKVSKEAEELGTPFKVYVSKVKHQRGRTECGIYSLYSIIGQLTDKVPVAKLLEDRVPDKDMEALRAKYFNVHL